MILKFIFKLYAIRRTLSRKSNRCDKFDALPRRLCDW